MVVTVSKGRRTTVDRGEGVGAGRVDTRVGGVKGTERDENCVSCSFSLPPGGLQQWRGLSL